jgi:2-polyprenyl-6-methoxyphenol hydroxylase-like FAD-dependent oxidoreductase
MPDSETSVLVVGAGPVGLALACDLARRGVACRIVDDGEGPTPEHESRALAIWERTLEVLDGLGAIGPVLERGKRLHGINAFAGGRRVLHVGLDLDAEDTPYPFVISLPQGLTERALIERLAALGVGVEWGTRLDDLAADASGVSATLARPGGAEAARAAWLVGCDGARSAVRHRLGVPFEGAEYDELFLLADATLRWDVPDDEARVQLPPGGGPFAAFPLPGERRWRLIDAGGQVEAADEPAIARRFRTFLSEHASPPAELAEVHWTSGFRIHRRIAGRFRVGRCLLAGDAAHIHSPVGGQGMNTGIHDASNLGWKLALVLGGHATEALLDSYEAERRPVALDVLKGSDRFTRAITLRHPLAAGLRNALMGIVGEFEFVRRKVARALSELDVEYHASPIVAEDRAGPLGEPGPGAWARFSTGPRPGDRAPDAPLGPDRRLFEALRGPDHALLLFEGETPDAGASRTLLAIAQAAGRRPGPTIRPHLVSRGEVPSTAGPVLPDPDGHAHRRYGASAPCQYLIRPDGYVGYRSQPPSIESLDAYLARTFGAPTAG